MPYKNVKAGEVVKLGRAPVRYRMMCCDCGLVHLLRFRVVKGEVSFQAWRDNRSTAAYRRKGKFRASIPKRNGGTKRGRGER
jgi:hypothetical protein